MNKIKDFFYNKNDIIIVLIILIAAGLIIYTRISAIMDYPETLAQQNAKAQQTTQAAQVLHAGTIQKEIASGESGVDKQKSASEKKNRWFKRLFRG